jgi:hypothetical protein
LKVLSRKKPKRKQIEKKIIITKHSKGQEKKKVLRLVTTSFISFVFIITILVGGRSRFSGLIFSFPFGIIIIRRRCCRMRIRRRWRIWMMRGRRGRRGRSRVSILRRWWRIRGR